MYDEWRLQATHSESSQGRAGADADDRQPITQSLRGYSCLISVLLYIAKTLWCRVRTGGNWRVNHQYNYTKHHGTARDQ